jgi:1-acyl-sn-glycerol-3-phosphate acyltransferase
MIAHANEFLTRLFHECVVVAPPQLPARGPAILVSNHTAGLDPLLLQSACERLIIWMMAAEYYHMPVLRPLFRALRMIPVQRSGRVMAAMRAALRELEQGRIVGIFPEGAIATDRRLLPFQTGVALLAFKSGAPVYPAYIDGTQRGRDMLPSLLRPCSAIVAFGPEVPLDRSDTTREGLERATGQIQAGVAALKDACDQPGFG